MIKNPLRDNSQRAKLAITMLWVCLVVDCLSVVSGMLENNLIQALANPDSVTEEMIANNELRQTTVGLLYGVAYLITAIFFIQWFRRAYYNLHQLKPIMKYTEGWAAGAWFVPFVNLYRPYEIARELYTKTKTLLNEAGLAENQPKTSLLLLWWIFWIIGGFIGQLSWRLTESAETLEQLANLNILNTVHSFISIPLTYLAMRVVKDYAAVEPLLIEVQNRQKQASHEDLSDNLIAE